MEMGCFQFISLISQSLQVSLRPNFQKSALYEGLGMTGLLAMTTNLNNAKLVNKLQFIVCDPVQGAHFTM